MLYISYISIVPRYLNAYKISSCDFIDKKANWQFQKETTLSTSSRW